MKRRFATDWQAPNFHTAAFVPGIPLQMIVEGEICRNHRGTRVRAASCVKGDVQDERPKWLFLLI
eukprot:1481905-Prorocentrum_lima.AAC.1